MERTQKLQYVLLTCVLAGVVVAAFFLLRAFAAKNKSAQTGTVMLEEAAALPVTYSMQAEQLVTVFDLLLQDFLGSGNIQQTAFLGSAANEVENKARMEAEWARLQACGFVVEDMKAYYDIMGETALCYTDNRHIRADFLFYGAHMNRGNLVAIVDASDGTILEVWQKYGALEEQAGDTQAAALLAYLGASSVESLPAITDGYETLYTCLAEELGLFATARVSPYRMVVAAYPISAYPVLLYENMPAPEGAPADNTQVTYIPLEGERLPLMRRAGFLCPAFTFYRFEDGTRMVDAAQTEQMQYTAQAAMQLLYDMYGYLPAASHVYSTPHGMYFCHSPTMRSVFEYIKSDCFFSVAIDADTGAFSGFSFSPGEGYPPHTGELVRWAHEQDYASIAQFFYEHSSYGTRAPVLRTETSYPYEDASTACVKLFIENDYFYMVDVNCTLALPVFMFGPYTPGYFG